MPTLIEVNVQTGEQIVREMTPEEVASHLAAQVEQPAPDPVEKLKSFLAANPDVAALLQ